MPLITLPNAQADGMSISKVCLQAARRILQTTANDLPELYLRKTALTRGVTLGSTADVMLWST